MNNLHAVIMMSVLAVSAPCLSALEGKIVTVEGKVELQRQGADWVPAQAGDVLAPGDIISTSFRSKALVEIGKSVLRITPLSRLTIEQLYSNANGEIASVYLDSGAVKASIKKETDRRVGFKIKTTAMVASVRGTEGIVHADGRITGTGGKWCITGPEPKKVMTEQESEQEDAEHPFDFTYPAAPGIVYVTKGQTSEAVSDGTMKDPQQTAEQSAAASPAASAHSGSKQQDTGPGVITLNMKVPVKQ